MVFLKIRLFVKWNNPEFTNVSSFTLHLMCSTHFKLSCGKLLALPTCNSFVQFVFAEIPVQSAWWGLLLRPLGVGFFSVQYNSSELDTFRFWSLISETLHFMQEVFIV